MSKAVMVRPGASRKRRVSQGSAGGASLGATRQVSSRLGSARQSGLGRVRQVAALHGTAGRGRHGQARRVAASQGQAGWAGPGMSWCDPLGHVSFRLGTAWQARSVSACLGALVRVQARLGSAGGVRQGAFSYGLARRVVAGVS